NDSALPLHRDATLKVRPRTFLEGGMFVDLHPGTPGTPELKDGDTIPVSSTATPVLLGHATADLRSATRDNLRYLFHAARQAWAGGAGATARGARPAAFGGAAGARRGEPPLPPRARLRVRVAPGHPQGAGDAAAGAALPRPGRGNPAPARAAGADLRGRPGDT